MSYYAHIFNFYKMVSELYNDHAILDCVKQLVPYTVLKSYWEDQSLKSLLDWFKIELMKWIPNDLRCSSCNVQIRVHVIEGDSLILRKIEVYKCVNVDPP
jgi:hypothetical protein